MEKSKNFFLNFILIYLYLLVVLFFGMPFFIQKNTHNFLPTSGKVIHLKKASESKNSPSKNKAPKNFQDFYLELKDGESFYVQ